MRLVDRNTMMELEQAADSAGHDYDTMMRLAGAAVAREIQARWPLARRPLDRRPNGTAVVLCGPGNNGGDGLVCATHLHDAGLDVRVGVWRRANDHWLAAVGTRGIPVCHLDGSDDQGLDPSCRAVLLKWLDEANIIVDALFGTGLCRPLEGAPAAILDAVRARRWAGDGDGGAQGDGDGDAQGDGDSGDQGNGDGDSGGLGSGSTADHGSGAQERAARMPVGASFAARPVASGRGPVRLVAVDVPSGLDADTGSLDQHAVPSDLCVTFGLPKLGQLAFPGAGALGRLVVDPIGIPEAAARAGYDLAARAPIEVATAEATRSLLPPRPADGHKGTFGRVLVVAGSTDYRGAALLAARAVGRAGAGLVTLASIADASSAVAMAAPEVTHVLLPERGGQVSEAAIDELISLMPSVDALLIGCGLGAGPGPTALVPALVEAASSLANRIVLDADALNALAASGTDLAALPPSVLTPHPGEMARLIGSDVAAVQRDRPATAIALSKRTGHVIVLKGAPTVIAAPDGRATVIAVATPALATAGTGDILAGLIAGLLAQGATAYDAAIAGAFVHVKAGTITARELGDRAVVAPDVLARIPAAFVELEGPGEVGVWAELE